MRAYLAIGSNIAPQEHIPGCLERLAEVAGLEIVARSSCYLTRPWGIEEQANFVNLAIGLETHLSPMALLRVTQSIEADLGRTRNLMNGPRTIDLDILLFGDRIEETQTLRIPHPGLLLRDFMLIPLVEIAPDAIHPERGRPLKELLGEIQHHQIIEKRPIDTLL